MKIMVMRIMVKATMMKMVVDMKELLILAQLKLIII